MELIVSFVPFCYFSQEKKGQEQMKPEEKEMQRRDFEHQKLEKLLSMVRQPDSNTKKEADKTAPNPTTQK